MSIFYFIFVLLGYAPIAIKIEKWRVISTLGFVSETPELYIAAGKVYRLFPPLLLIVSLVVGLWWGLPSWIVVGFLILLWEVCLRWGRASAFKLYRELMLSMYPTATDQAERETFLLGSTESNKNLTKKLKEEMRRQKEWARLIKPVEPKGSGRNMLTF